MNRTHLPRRRATAADSEQCLVLSLSGQRIGVLGRFAGDRFSVKTPSGETLWLSSSAIYLENPLYVELICLTDGLSRYIVDPPETRRFSRLNYAPGS